MKQIHTQHSRIAKLCSDKMTSIISSKSYDVGQPVDRWFVCVSGFVVLYLTASFDGAVMIAP